MNRSHFVPLAMAAGILATVFFGSPAIGGPSVVATSPGTNSYFAHPRDPVVVTFDSPIDIATVTPQTFRLLGKKASYCDGRFEFSENGFTYFPESQARRDGSMLLGDTVYGVVTSGIRSPDGDSVDPYVWTFRIGPRGGAVPQGYSTINLPAECGSGEIVRIIPADLNGDICDELILILRGEGTEDRICVLLGSGTGWGSVVYSQALPSDPTDVCTGDFDHDGLADIAVVSFQSSTVHVFLNQTPDYDRDSGIAFPVSLMRSDIDVEERGNVRVEPLDVDYDGDLDLVVGTAFHDLRVLRNQGGGIFTVESLGDLGSQRTPPVDMPDFGIGNLYEPGGIQVALGNLRDDQLDIWDAPYVGLDTVVGDGDIKARFVAPGKLLGDALVDILAVTVGDSEPSACILYENLGSGTFQIRGTECALEGIPRFFGLESILASASPQLILSYPEDGRLEIMDAFTCSILFSSQIVANPGAVAVSDLGADGDLDLVVIDNEERRLVIFENPALSPDPVFVLEGCQIDFGTANRCPTHGNAIQSQCSIRNIFDHAVYLNSFGIVQQVPGPFRLIDPPQGSSIRLEPGETYDVIVEFDLGLLGNEDCGSYEVFQGQVRLQSCDCGCVVYGDVALVDLSAESELAIEYLSANGRPIATELDLGLYDECELELAGGRVLGTTVQVQNIGRSYFIVDDVSLPAGDTPFAIEVAGGLPRTLNAGETLSLEVYLESGALPGSYQEAITIRYQNLYDCSAGCQPIPSSTVTVKADIRDEVPEFVPSEYLWTIPENTTSTFSFTVDWEGSYGLRLLQVPVEYQDYLQLDTPNSRLVWHRKYLCKQEGDPGLFHVLVEAWDPNYDPDITCVKDTLDVTVDLVCQDDAPRIVEVDSTPDSCIYPYLCSPCNCSFDSLPAVWSLDGNYSGKRVRLCTAEAETLMLVVESEDPEGVTTLLLTGSGIDSPDPVGETIVDGSRVVWKGTWTAPVGFTGDDACREAFLQFHVRQEDDPSKADTVDIEIPVSAAKPNLQCDLFCDAEGQERTVGETVHLRGIVRNVGFAKARPFQVWIRQTSPVNSIVFNAQIDQELLSGEQTDIDDIFCEVILDRTGEFGFELLVDVQNEVIESHEDDNQCETTSPVFVREGELCICPVPITPNNDSYNDVMRFNFAQRYPRNSPRLRVFDLDRHMIYDSDERKGQDVPMGDECRRCRGQCPGGGSDCVLVFDGRDSDGTDVPGGLYLYVFSLNGEDIAHGEVVIIR